MATTTPPQDPVDQIPPIEEELAGVEIADDQEEIVVAPLPIVRLSIVVGLAVISAAVMAGGIFVGFAPRIYAAVAGILGVVIAARGSKIRRQTTLFPLLAAALFLVGVLMVIPTGTGNVFSLSAFVKQAVKAGDIHRPPVEFDPGWHAILGWMMAGLGFVAGWVAIVVRKPALGILVPLPVVAITAISVPDTGSPSAQILSGIASLIFFAISMGTLSSTQVEVGEDEQKPDLKYEMRRAMRALPLIGVISAVLLFLPNVLFPPPRYDPTQEAKKPQTVPITKVPDKVLFKVKSNVTGPWRMGGLDVYEPSDSTWRLPPFAQSKLKPVKKSGVVDTELIPGVRADIEIVTMGGAVLPGLPNLVGLVAEGPRFSYDDRTGNIRLAAGTITPGLTYSVIAASIPTVEELRQLDQDISDQECTDGVSCSDYMKIPPPPPAVQDLLAKSGATNPWDRMDFLRQHLLKTVVSSGSGSPKAVSPDRVEDMLIGTKEGTPYEIVAAQAMLARWAGVPSRIGYGFDGGEKKGEFLEVRPKHGATYLEVYFPTFKWLPVIGTPLQAKTSAGTDPQQFNENVAASNDIAVKVFVPIALDPRSYLYAQIRHALLIILPIILALLLLYYGYPALKKAYIVSRRRAWAQTQGPRARIGLAYAEWRDFATDFGYRFDADTPLMFLDRVVEDPEHTELAWLVTRALWGDLRQHVGEQDAAAAESMSKSLRKRLGQGHSATLRAVAAVSRLSLKHPYAPALTETKREVEREAKAA